MRKALEERLIELQEKIGTDNEDSDLWEQRLLEAKFIMRLLDEHEADEKEKLHYMYDH